MIESEAETYVDKHLDTLGIEILVGVFEAVEVTVVESALLVAVGQDVLLVRIVATLRLMLRLIVRLR